MIRASQRIVGGVAPAQHVGADWERQDYCRYRSGAKEVEGCPAMVRRHGSTFILQWF